jgi:hypothetical protein
VQWWQLGKEKAIKWSGEAGVGKIALAFASDAEVFYCERDIFSAQLNRRERIETLGMIGLLGAVGKRFVLTTSSYIGEGPFTPIFIEELLDYMEEIRPAVLEACSPKLGYPGGPVFFPKEAVPLFPFPNLAIGMRVSRNNQLEFWPVFASSFPAALRFVYWTPETALSDLMLFTGTTVRKDMTRDKAIDWLVIEAQAPLPSEGFPMDWVRDVVARCRVDKVPVFWNGRGMKEIRELPLFKTERSKVSDYYRLRKLGTVEDGREYRDSDLLACRRCQGTGRIIGMISSGDCERCDGMGYLLPSLFSVETSPRFQGKKIAEEDRARRLKDAESVLIEEAKKAFNAPPMSDAVQRLAQANARISDLAAKAASGMVKPLQKMAESFMDLAQVVPEGTVVGIDEASDPTGGQAIIRMPAGETALDFNDNPPTQWQQVECGMCLGVGLIPAGSGDVACEVCGGEGTIMRRVPTTLIGASPLPARGSETRVAQPTPVEPTRKRRIELED